MTVPRRPALLSHRLSSLVLLSAVAAAAAPSLAQAEPPRAEQPRGVATPAPSPAPNPAAEPKPAPAGQPAAGRKDATPKEAAPKEAGDVRDRVLPEVAFTDVQVEDMMQFLQDVSGDRFRAVIVHRGGVKVGPAVTMRLRNVTLGQVLDVLTTAYPSEVNIRAVDGPTGPVSVVTLTPPDDANGDGGGRAADRQGQAVRVYRLSGIVEQMVLRKPPPGQIPNPLEEDEKRLKAALNHVLSLVKATLQLSDGADRPTLQVHEETQTLIFRGTPAQRAALEDVLAALETAKAIRPATPSEQADRRQKELNATLERARAEADTVKAEAAKKIDRLEEELQKMNGVMRDKDAVANEKMNSVIREMNAALRDKDAVANELKAKLDALRERGPRSDAGPKPSAIVIEAVTRVGDLRQSVESMKTKLGTEHPSVEARVQELKTATDWAARLAATEYGEENPTVGKLREESAHLDAEIHPEGEMGATLRATARNQMAALRANDKVIEDAIWSIDHDRKVANARQLPELKAELERVRRNEQGLQKQLDAWARRTRIRVAVLSNEARALDAATRELTATPGDKAALLPELRQHRARAIEIWEQAVTRLSDEIGNDDPTIAEVRSGLNDFKQQQ